MSACAFSRCGVLFHFQLCSRCPAFVLVDQYLKLCRKFRVGCADRQALEEKRPFVKLFAPVLLDQLVRLVHRAPPRKLPALARPIAILELNPAHARQEKPVNHHAGFGSLAGTLQDGARTPCCLWR